MKPSFLSLFFAFTVILTGCTTSTKKISPETINTAPDITVGDPELEFIAMGQTPGFGPTTSKWDLIARYGPLYIADPASPANTLGYTFARFNPREAKGTLSKVIFTLTPENKVTGCKVSSEPITQPPTEGHDNSSIPLQDEFKFPLPAGQSTGYLQNGRFRIHYKTSKWTRIRLPDFSNGKEPPFTDLAYNENEAIFLKIKTQTPDFGSFSAESLISGTIKMNPYAKIPINESRIIKNLLVRQIHFTKRTPPSGILRIIYIIYEGKQGQAEIRISLKEENYERYKQDIEELINSFEISPDQPDAPKSSGPGSLPSSR